LQNTIAFGDHITGRAFILAKNRFEALKILINQIETTQDLKSISELQATINLLLGIIQNETIKFQIATHSFKSKKALINQRKNQLYAAVFKHTNTEMPNIKSVQAKF
ncbi:type IV secretion system protein, partial [Bartonella sp. AC66GZZY]|uniref:type IV secretion system protein n=1 Tax=Bartonella sp. AC66GZZY TaxID=3243458 RepID=UPI0035D0BE44